MPLAALRRLSWAPGLASLLACSAPAPAPSAPAPSASSASAPAAPATASVPAPAPVASVEPAVPVLPAPALPPFEGPVLPADESGFHAGEQVVMMDEIASGGVAVPARYQAYGGCVRRKVGARAGFLCLGSHDSERSGHSVSSMSIFVVEGKRLREIFSFPHQARALDFPEAIYATLRVDYDDEQGKLRLEDGSLTCEAATRSADDSLEFQRVVDRLCRARGVYALKGAAFVRQGSAPPLRWPGGPRRSIAPPGSSGF